VRQPRTIPSPVRRANGLWHSAALPSHPIAHAA